MLTESLLQATPFLNKLVGRVIVVKLGGSALGSHDTTLADTVALSRLGVRVVIVHGGGAAISEWIRRIGKEPRFVNGLRVTDAETMEIVTMVLAGKVNKELVASLCSLGGRAVGVSGLDGGLIRARRVSPELELVGEVREVDPYFLDVMLDAETIPVVAPIALGDNGECLNVNADTAAAEVAIALDAERLVFLTDVVGVCAENGELISRLTGDHARQLISQGVISGGMIPKAEACIRALEGVASAQIVDGRVPHALMRELLTDRSAGTTFSREQ